MEFIERAVYLQKFSHAQVFTRVLLVPNVFTRILEHFVIFLKYQINFVIEDWKAIGNVDTIEHLVDTAGVGKTLKR